MISILPLILLVLAADARPWKAGDPCPTEIHTTVPGLDWDEPGGKPSRKPTFATMVSIHDAMLNCPNITSLDVRVAYLGCSESPDRWNFPFDLQDPKLYPSAPQVLSLDGYDFDEVEWGNVQPPKDLRRWDYWITSGRALKYWRWRSLPEGQRSKRNLILWLDSMDFSRVHTLQLNQISREDVSDFATELLSSVLPSLTTLAVVRPKAQDFVLWLPRNSLRNLTWLDNDNMSSFRPVLEHHGASLTDLSWHVDETMYRPRPVLTLAQLQELGTLAPGLRSLVIDLGRGDSNDDNGDGGDDEGSWPWEHLRAVAAGLPELTDLTVYVDLVSECRRRTPNDYGPGSDGCPRDCRGAAQYAQPLVNRTTAREVAGFLREHKAGRPLRRVELRSGDWMPPWDGPLYIPDWLEGQQAWVECELGGGEGGTGADGISCHGQDTRIIDRYRGCEDELDAMDGAFRQDPDLVQLQKEMEL